MRDYGPYAFLNTQPLAAKAPASSGLTSDMLWRRERLPPSPSDLSINLATEMWMKSLPEGFKPNQTSAQYPRIVNRLARYWDSPAMIEGVFDDLLYAKRRGRKGFAPAIQAEINALFNLYQSQNPPIKGKEDLWDSERLNRARTN